MPIIDLQSTVQPKSIAELYIEAALEGESTFSFSSQANLTVTATVTAGRQMDLESEAELTVEATLLGGVQGEPNVFFESQADLTVTATVAGSAIKDLNSQADLAVAATLSPETNDPETFEMRMIVALLPARPTGGLMFAERLTVDGVEVPVTEWSIEWPDRLIEHRLEVQLANVADAALFTRESEIKFEVGWASPPFDTWNWLTLMEAGQAENKSYQIQPRSAGPDRVTVTGLSLMQERLNKTAATRFVIYDPTRVTLDADDFEVIYDSQGRSYTTELIAMPGMTVYKIFQRIFKDECGFSSVSTNVPDAKLTRMDFEAGRPLMEPIAGVIGAFLPDFEELGDELWIRDTTAAYPAGFPAPPVLELSSVPTLEIGTEFARVDAVRMTYNLWTYDYDFTTTRTRPFVSQSTNSGQTTTTTITTTFVEYRRNSNPSVVIHDEKARIHTLVQRPDGWVIENSTENFYYDGTDLVRRTKQVQQTVPDLTDPPNFPDLLDRVADEDERFYYKGHPFALERKYEWRRLLNVRGLIAVDTENQQLGRDFKRPLVEANRKGDLNEAMTIEDGPISTEDVFTEVISKEDVFIQAIEIDHLTGNSARSYGEQRVGDVGRSALVNVQKTMLVFDEENAERSEERLFDINIGEYSPLVGIDLCQRRLRNLKQRPMFISGTAAGIDPTLRRGSARTIVDREGETVGIFGVKGLRMNGGRSGYFTTVTRGAQIG